MLIQRRYNNSYYFDYYIICMQYICVCTIYRTCRYLYQHLINNQTFKKVFCSQLLLLIIYHDFLPPARRGSHVKSDNTHTIINIHPLAHIFDTCAMIFSSCTLTQFIPIAYITASHPAPGDNHQSTGGRSERTQGQAKMAR